jgi:hypothetical protein
LIDVTQQPHTRTATKPADRPTPTAPAAIAADLPMVCSTDERRPAGHLEGVALCPVRADMRQRQGRFRAAGPLRGPPAALPLTPTIPKQCLHEFRSVATPATFTGRFTVQQQPPDDSNLNWGTPEDMLYLARPHRHRRTRHPPGA